MATSEGEVGRLPERVAVEQVERLLESLSGIDACRVVASEWGALEEIHVLVGEDRHPKQAVRDIESALAARWKLRVDHKKISVAQIAAETPAPSAAQQTMQRLHLDSLRTVSKLDEARLEVSLTLRDGNGRVIEGSASASNNRSSNPRVFALAAVSALNAIFDGETSAQLEDIEVVRMSSGEVVVCLVGLGGARGAATTRAGAAVVVDEDRGRAAIAAVLSTLDGTNQSTGSMADLAGDAPRFY